MKNKYTTFLIWLLFVTIGQIFIYPLIKPAKGCGADYYNCTVEVTFMDNTKKVISFTDNQSHYNNYDIDTYKQALPRFQGEVNVKGVKTLSSKYSHTDNSGRYFVRFFLVLCVTLLVIIPKAFIVAIDCKI